MSIKELPFVTAEQVNNLRTEAVKLEYQIAFLKERLAWKQKGLDEMLAAFSGAFMAKELHQKYSSLPREK